MSLIYEPKGKAREYSPLALNVYSGGCDHGCDYCYCSGIFRGAWSRTPRPRDLHALPAEAVKARRQILLSFVGDPYCAAELVHRKTRYALAVLSSARCSVAVLTKGGFRCLEDLPMFLEWPDGRVKVGATLTCMDPTKSVHHEPGAALPAERLEALKILHEAGVKTWASIEPVLYPDESLALIKSALPFVDAFKVGKLNHRKNTVDWASFGRDAIALVRGAGKRLYVKDDLRAFLPGECHGDECNADSLALPDRP